MSAARRSDPEARREQLLDAALVAIAAKGVAATSVSDIVREAGVAQGTFYLYFPSKDAALDALVARIADQIVETLEAEAARHVDAVAKLRAVLGVFTRTAETPAGPELVEFSHDPAHRAIHERMEARLVPRLEPIMRAIVEQGVAEGAFDVPDPAAASWFVLGGLHSVEIAGTSVRDMPAAIEAASELALRTLGYEEGDGR